MSRLEARGLRLSYGPVAVLRGLHLDVETGELLAVLGPSGCGKTTLLRALAGLERIDAGTIEVAGVPLAGPGLHIPAHRRRLAVVPQEGALFPHLTVCDNIGFGLSRAERRGPRVATLLALAGLADLGARRPQELSGGQQQRVAVARALAPSPAVVLLDEPFSALDPALRASVRREVVALLRAEGTTAVLVTHDQEEALSVADRVAIMRGGVIAQVGSPAEVYRLPIDLDVARFLGEANVVDGRRVGRGDVSCVLGRTTAQGAPARGAVRVLVRPEQITLDGATPGRIVDCAYYGHDAMLTVELPTGERLRVRTHGDAVEIDQPVRLGVTGPLSCYPL